LVAKLVAWLKLELNQHLLSSRVLMIPLQKKLAHPKERNLFLVEKLQADHYQN
jgi:hypothetical protein